MQFFQDLGGLGWDGTISSLRIYTPVRELDFTALTFRDLVVQIRRDIDGLRSTILAFCLDAGHDEGTHRIGTTAPIEKSVLMLATKGYQGHILLFTCNRIE
jgi:hypothetical protein